MKNGNLNDFIDGLHYGQEVVFLFRNKRFFVQGWWEGETAYLVLECVESDKPKTAGYVWEYSAPTMTECAEAFLAAEIWDGKTFLDMESEMTWTEWE